MMLPMPIDWRQSIDNLIPSPTDDNKYNAIHTQKPLRDQFSSPVTIHTNSHTLEISNKSVDEQIESIVRVE